MQLENKKVGLAITGSFCNFSKIHDVILQLKAAGADVLPIISFSTKEYDTRFYKKKDFLEMVEKTSENKIIDSIVKAEPIGPKDLVDVIVICPCTGNSLAKLVTGITDTPVLMATKSHIRNNKPVVIGVSTNDGLGVNLQNIGVLLNTKNMYFIPFKQDNYVSKPKSLVLDYTYVIDTITLALKGEQIQPLLSK